METGTFTSFMDIVGEMESVMRSLMKGLEVEPNWQINSEIVLSTIKKGNWEWRKLKWSFGRKKREALLQRFEKYNQTLAKYADQLEILAPPPGSRSKELSRYFHKVRDHACRVYDALDNSWECRCSYSHIANLQLEPRDCGVTSPHFSVTLSFLGQSELSQPQWVETCINVGETNAQPPIRIPSLCEALQLPQNPPAVLGFLTNAALDQRVDVSTVLSTQASVHGHVSLGGLVVARSPSMQSHRPPGNLSGRQRLSIAVSLAHTVLQLHDSPWLSESWSKHNIWFFTSDVDGNERPNIERPYISRSFEPRSHQNASNTRKGATILTDPYSHLIVNKYLFALGVVLIELALKRPFEDLCAEAMNAETPALERSYTTTECFQVATSLIDTVYDEQGTQYGKKRLEVDAFRAAVCEGVLAPLEEDLKRYAIP
ncbi:MAG: hypothetical protein Q9169_006442 [Polycauliona sp. 2 TL-2023]